MSITQKRMIAAGVGLLYTVIYGFFTILLTGAGHGNFFWFGLFFLSQFGGLYAPGVAALSIDLNSILAKSICLVLIAVSLFVSFIIVGSDDYSKSLAINGYLTTAFCAGMQFLPTTVFAIIFVRSFFVHRSTEEIQRKYL